jgi:rRNA processing
MIYSYVIQDAHPPAGPQSEAALAQERRAPPTSSPHHRSTRTSKHIPSLERLASKVKEAKDGDLQDRQEQQRQRQERKNRVEADLKRRKQDNKVFRKKTQKGQPVMKYRIEKMLEKLV